MVTGDLPSTLLRLIRSSVPTFPAAELLVFLYRHPGRGWTIEEISEGMRPAIILRPAIQEYLSMFVSQGLVSEAGGGFAYTPASADVDESVGELTRAYNERPVTLIRTIYSIADLKIQSFADSFRLRDGKSQEQDE